MENHEILIKLLSGRAIFGHLGDASGNAGSTGAGTWLFQSQKQHVNEQIALRAIVLMRPRRGAARIACPEQ